MFNYHREEIEWGGRKLVLETGKVARQADGAVMATYGETVVLATAVGEQEAQAGNRFLSADRQLPGKILCLRKNPRWLFQARRPSHRARDADLTSDRPADPAAFRAGLPQ